MTNVFKNPSNASGLKATNETSLLLLLRHATVQMFQMSHAVVHIVTPSGGSVCWWFIFRDTEPIPGARIYIVGFRVMVP